MRRFLAVVSLLVLSGCSGGGDESATVAADTLTRRERDSIIAGSRIPGAGAVGRALQSSDAAAAHATAHDTIP